MTPGVPVIEIDKRLMQMTRQLGIVAGTVVECRETQERMQRQVTPKEHQTPLTAAIDSIDSRELRRLLARVRGEAHLMISASHALIESSLQIERDIPQ